MQSQLQTVINNSLSSSNAFTGIFTNTQSISAMAERWANDSKFGSTRTAKEWHSLGTESIDLNTNSRKYWASVDL